MSEHENPAPAGFSVFGAAAVKEVREVEEVGEVEKGIRASGIRTKDLAGSENRDGEKSS